jgi:F-type H+-transporting ATPase subunit b
MFLLAFAEGSSIQLVPDGTMLIHVALILIMIWILNRTLFRPINRIIASREKNKGGRSTEAEEIMRDVEAKRERYDLAMRDARSNGYNIIQKERDKALKKKEEKIGSVKEAVAIAFAEESTELERQVATARTAIESEAVQLADKISANILKQ